MIVIASEEMALGLRLAGVKNAYPVKSRQDGISLLKDIGKKEFIIATENVMKFLPEIGRFENVVVFPDSAQDFSKIDDLKALARLSIGAEVNL